MPDGPIDVVVSGGIRQDADPRVAGAGALRECKNLIFKTPAGAEPRNGTVLLSCQISGSSSNVADCKRLMSNGSALYVVDGDFLNSYSSVGNRCIQSDEIHQVYATRDAITESDGNLTSGMDAAYGSGYTVYAYCKGTDIYGTVVDTNGVRIIADVLISSTTSQDPRVLICGTTAIILWSNTAGALLHCSKLDLTAVSSGFSAPTNLGVILSGTGSSGYAWDASTISGLATEFWVVRCTKVTATIQFQGDRFSASSLASLSNTGVVNGPAGGTAVHMATCATTAERAWVIITLDTAGTVATYAWSWTLSGGLVAEVVATSMSLSFVTGGGLNVVPTVARLSALVAVVGVTGTDSSVTKTKWATINSSATVDGTWTLRYHQLLSRILVRSGKAYGVVIGTTYFSLPGTVIGYWDTAFTLIDLEMGLGGAARLGRTVARLGPRVCQPPGNNFRRCSNLFSTENSDEYAGLGSIRAGSQVQTNRLGLAKLTFAFDGALNWAPVLGPGGTVVVCGGIPSVMDSKRVAEISFEGGPSSFSLTQSAGGGTITNGSYRYAAFWEWHNDAGQVDRSAPAYSSLLVFVNGPNGKVSLVWEGLPLSLKNDLAAGNTAGVALVICRTTDLTSNPASLYYRLYSEVYPSGTIATQDGGRLTYLDTSADASIVNNAPMYTTGGLLENQAPSAARHGCVHKGRVWLIGDDGVTLWFSRTMYQGEVPAFNDALTLSFLEAGKCTALASMDDKLVVLKDRGVYLITGEGPTDAGLGSDFSQPLLVSAEVGCDNWRSVVSTSLGVFFAHSKQGIYLLRRSGQLDWIGQRVKDYFAAYPTVTSAVAGQLDTLIYFTCSTTDTSITLVYHTDHDLWTTFDYTARDGGSVITTLMKSATVVNGKYTMGGAFQSSRALLYQEDSSQFRDGGTVLTGGVWVEKSITFGWLLSGANGDMIARRMQIHGEYMSNHNLRVSFYRNFSDSADTSPVVAEANISATLLESIRFGPKYMRCQSMSVQITDANTINGSGASLKVHGVSWDVVPLRGPNPRIGPGAQK